MSSPRRPTRSTSRPAVASASKAKAPAKVKAPVAPKAPGSVSAPRKPRARRKPSPDARAFAVVAARLLKDRHCESVLVFDVQGRSDVTDYIVIASGTSDRQIRSLADELEDLAKAHGLIRLGRDADTHASWVVVDIASVVFHLFDPATRAHYDLEMLWGDAPKVRWQRRVTAKPATKP